MANPQIENGYLKIAHEIAQALARVNLSAYESRVLWVIWRKTLRMAQEVGSDFTYTVSERDWPRSEAYL